MTFRLKYELGFLNKMLNIGCLNIYMSLLKIKNRKEVFSWSLYDFANQPFTTIIVTFIYSSFFTKVIAENEQVGTVMWSYAIASTAIIVGFLSPILGAIADRGGYRKFFFNFLYLDVCVILNIFIFSSVRRCLACTYSFYNSQHLF